MQVAVVRNNAAVGGAATVPAAPAAPTAVPGNTTATVSWAAPANGGSPITGYVVTPYIAGVAQAATTVGNVLTTSITGLTNGTAYTFKVAAINAVGTGPQSAASNAVTPVSSLIPHTDTFDRANSTTGLGTSSGGLPWTSLAGTVGINNNAAYAPVTVSRSVLDVNEENGTIAVTITTLQSVGRVGVIFRRVPGGGFWEFTYYTIGDTIGLYLVRKDSSGNQITGPSFVTIPAPTAPYTLKVEYAGNTIKLYNSAGTVIATVQDSYYMAGERGKHVGVSFDGVGSPSSGRLDNFQVTAAPAPSAPQAPPFPEVNTGFNPGSVVLKWLQPLDNFGPITGYTITPYIAGVAQTPVTVGNVLTTTITGLTVGTAYTFKIKALNSAGASPDSSTSSAVTPITGYSVYPNSAGYITSYSSTSYSDARAGSALASGTADYGQPGQDFQYGYSSYHGSIPDYWEVYEQFLGFDTSAIPGTISAATLHLYLDYDGSGVDFVAEARLNDHGATVENADFVPGATLASKTLLATLSTVGVTTGGYRAFTNVALPANINRSGSTRMVIASDRTRTGVAPTAQEKIAFNGQNYDRRSKLVIEAA